MSLINAFEVNYSLYSYTATNSADIDSYDFEEMPSDEASASLDTQIINIENRVVGSGLGREINSFFVESFVTDYYERIHVVPQVIQLGNLLTAQSRTVYVWNAYRDEDKTLSSISDVGVTSGLTLVEPSPTPLLYKPTQEREYTLNIATSGPAVIDGGFAFNFPGESPTVRVLGRRVVVWAFKPSMPYEERFENNTDVKRTPSKETRTAILVPARQVFKYTFPLDDVDFSKAKAISTQFAQRLYAIPVWLEKQDIASISSGASTIPVSTNLLSYRADSLALIWKNSDEFEVVEVLSVQSNQITLKLPTQQSWTNVKVMPIRFGYTLNGINFDRSNPGIIFAGAEFLIMDNADEGRSIGFPTYRSKPVYSLPNVSANGLQERIYRAVEVFDNGTGPVVLEEEYNYADFRQEVSIYCDTATDRLNARDWLQSLKGRYESFWLPTFNTDLVLDEDALSTQTSIIVKSIGYNLYYTTKDIAVFMKNGTIYYFRVTAGADIGGGQEQLTLSAQIGVNLNVADVDKICFMSHVRLDTDVITIDYLGDEQAFITVPVTETPE